MNNPAGFSLPSSVRRILIIRRKALGDVLVTLPAVAGLQRAFPDAQIDLIVERPFQQLVARHTEGVRVLAWPPPPSSGSWLQMVRNNAYDLVIDFLGSPRTALWTALSGAPLRVGYDLRGRRWAYNIRVPRNRGGEVDMLQFAGETFLDPLRELGIPAEPWQPVPARSGFRLPDGLGSTEYLAWREIWRRQSRPRIGMMFSATWPAKAWPASEAGGLYRLLLDNDMVPVFIPGPGDECFTRQLLNEIPKATVAPPTDLLELADLLTFCDLFVGTDCGARHLATCVGLPTVTIFGPTNASGWNPASPRHVSVRTGVECSPCDKTTCDVAGHPCLDELAAGMVFAAIARILRSELPASKRFSGSRSEE